MADPVVKTEKPHHYNYLKLYRVEQCKDFLEKRCGNHRPYTCFFWHFPNQRRRRPVKLRDGSFNYTPDVYCTQYDENKGCCPSGDSCRFAHRNLGDTEKRYHLRYYKTEQCVNSVDAKGFCVRNGQHCAFAHGSDDIRAPLYDSGSTAGSLLPSAGQQLELMKELGAGDSSMLQLVSHTHEMINQWNDKDYLLKHYKVERCPQLTDQQKSQQPTAKPYCKLASTGCCPYWHTESDRRRDLVDIHKCKYRSVGCPDVRESDGTWSSRAECSRGDDCTYCHTLIELQYHPDIYKTLECTKQLEGKCRKGAFCPFIHSVVETSGDVEETASDVAGVTADTEEPGDSGTASMATKLNQNGKTPKKKTQLFDKDSWWANINGGDLGIGVGSGGTGGSGLDEFSAPSTNVSTDWLNFTSLSLGAPSGLPGSKQADVDLSLFGGINRDKMPSYDDAGNSFLFTSLIPPNLTSDTNTLLRLSSLIDDDDEVVETNDDDDDNDKVNVYGAITKPKPSSSTSSRSSSRAVAAAVPQQLSAAALGLDDPVVNLSNGLLEANGGYAEIYKLKCEQIQKEKQKLELKLSDQKNQIEKLQEANENLMKSSANNKSNTNYSNGNEYNNMKSQQQQLWSNHDESMGWNELDINSIPISLLQNKESALRYQLLRIQETIYRRRREEGLGTDCMLCGAKNSVQYGNTAVTSSNNIGLVRRQKCYHTVLCSHCTSSAYECPICHMQFN